MEYSYLSGRGRWPAPMEKLIDSMVIVARGASRNVRIVRIYPLTVLFTFTMVIIIYCILGLTTIICWKDKIWIGGGLKMLRLA